MKHLPVIVFIFIITLSCKTANNKNGKINTKNIANTDTLKISNPELDYDIIIIEPSYNSWLQTTAKPKGFYSQNYLETKNYLYVTEWNSRVYQSQKFSTNLYEMTIDYEPNINYGYDVNYQLYNYFVFFQNKYNQNLLGGSVPAN